MSPDAWITLFTIVACLGALSLTRLPADVILLGGVGTLLLLDVLSVKSALVGFSNEGVATVGVLYVVAHALSATGAVEWMSSGILGRPRSLRMAQFRLMAPVVFFSSVMNNTPVVAMMVPVVTDWSRRLGFPASQLMMPLSFAAIIGGICTLIGTSTNLIINGMLQQLEQDIDLGLFDLVWIGVPCSLAVMAFIMLTSRRLLPFKQGAALSFEDTRQYSVEMIVEPDSPIAGRSIEDAGLRHLPGLYLAEIVRGDRVIGRVSPLVHLQANDRLVFVGNVDTVVELKKVTGLVSAENQVFKLDHGGERSLVEVVIGPDFPLLGKSVREGNFRKYYGAVIIAVCRDGKQIKQRIGDIELKPGDTVLLETNSEFVRKQRFSRDFLVVSPVADFQPARSSKRWIAIGIMLVMVLSAATGLLSMFKAAMVAGGLMIITRCCTMDGARRSISWQVLAAIAASLGIGKAMEESGLAALIADFLVASAAGSELATMLVLFFVTAVFSALITNAAAAVLMFPIAVAASNDLGVSVIPYAVTLMVAASASFSTPIGYQTNMMVWGPGEYRFIDFLRLGIPLTVLVGAVTMFVVPLIWPFQV